MDVEVLDLDAHKYLVLQLWDVGVADVEVSDVTLLLRSFVTCYFRKILPLDLALRISYLVLWSLDPLILGRGSILHLDLAPTFLSSSHTTLSLKELILLQSTSRPRGFFSQVQ